MTRKVPVLPTTKASDLFESYRNALGMAEQGCRAQLIYGLTACPMPAVRHFVEINGGVTKDKGGRQPRSVNALLEHVRLHVPASFFLKLYIAALEHYGGSRGVPHADAFLRALMVLKSSLRDPSRGTLEFGPDHAFLVMQLYHSGKASLKSCPQCRTVYMVSSEPLMVRAHLTSGECPLCRTLVGVQKGRSVVRVPDARQQRKILEMFASGPIDAGVPEETRER